ncbi:hypothetical protein [Pseudomonas thivervalensis]|uniref:hypothetical protein n=1 Tax=Pseudomonas thivervalensis TaxID=86265 RepID=UPI003D9752E0
MTLTNVPRLDDGSVLLADESGRVLRFADGDHGVISPGDERDKANGLGSEAGSDR